jgi:hypothetical protein
VWPYYNTIKESARLRKDGLIKDFILLVKTLLDCCLMTHCSADIKALFIKFWNIKKVGYYVPTSLFRSLTQRESRTDVFIFWNSREHIIRPHYLPANSRFPHIKPCLIRASTGNHHPNQQFLIITYDRYKRERLRRRIYTLIKQGYKVGEFNSIEVTIIILNYGRFSTFRSTNKDSWPPLIPEIVCFYADSLRNTI